MFTSIGVAALTSLALQAPAKSSSAIIAFSALIDRVLQYAILLAAVGTVAMALLEAIKKLFDFRTKFHADNWAAFMKSNGYVPPSGKPTECDAFVALLQLASGVNLEQASAAVQELTGGVNPRPKPRIALAEARTLTQRVSNNGKQKLVPTFWMHPKAAYSVFAQPTGAMVTTLGDAADVALAAPNKHESLFSFLVRGASNTDIERWMDADGSPAVGSSNESAQEKKERAERAREAAGALSRLRLQARRKLAAFQLFTEQSWASWNQLWANVLGVIVMGIVMVNLDLSALQMLLGAAFGGILSPVAKDLVSALDRAKADLKTSAS